MLSWLFGNKAEKNANHASTVQASASGANLYDYLYDGQKFAGGMGDIPIFDLDYWALRKRSHELFHSNPYARGIIRRLVNNEINTGLSPEAAPDETIIGLPEDSLNDWTEEVENRFSLWTKNPILCDFHEKDSFGEIQRKARTEALIAGDILVVLHFNKNTNLPQVELVRGDCVESPLLTKHKISNDHSVHHGVEMDAKKRVVAYWITQEDGSSKRIPAYGRKTGRRISWLVYGTDRRVDDVRGQPLLSIVMQSLKEIDRYKDAVQRKAVINSMMAMFIEKTQDKLSSLPITGGAVRKDVHPVNTGTSSAPRNFKSAALMPGMVIEELQHGEKPVAFETAKTDINFGAFESAVLRSIAWANNIPPEILELAFSNNYSASQAAINEFKIYLNLVWSSFGDSFCQPIYQEWLISEILNKKIRADGFLKAWRDPLQYDVLGAWLATDWYGSIKPSTDMYKQTKGSKMLVDNGWSTNAREARIMTGTKFSKNIKRLKRENEMVSEALKPIYEMRAQYAGVNVENVNSNPQAFSESALDAIRNTIVDALNDQQTVQ